MKYKRFILHSGADRAHDDCHIQALGLTPLVRFLVAQDVEIFLLQLFYRLEIVILSQERALPEHGKDVIEISFACEHFDAVKQLFLAQGS